MERFRGTGTAWCGCACRTAPSPTARYDRKDAFYRRAKEEGYRSRAAFKARDLAKRLPQLRRGARVVELGCWPGGWLQVLLERVGDHGRVVGVDIEEIEPIEGVTFLCLDFTEADASARIADALGEKADAVLSDAAPKLTGIRDVDRAAHEELCEAALAVAESLLASGGALVVKGFPGPEADAFRRSLRARFGGVSEVRPEGKRSTSKEFYWVATPFRGPPEAP